MKLSELLDTIDGYIVGGAVRDKLMHRTPTDYDVVTTLMPSEVRERVDIAYAIGEKFGTLAVATSDVGVVEVTTARSDITAGRHPTVSWTYDIMKDLKRRDFTMNALIMNNDGIIGGVAQGIQDIDDEIIRCVGDPKDRFNEDPLRAMRAIRFMVQLDFTLDDKIEDALSNFNLKVGTEVAGTRIMDELKKMFEVNASRSVLLLSDYGLLNQILPEVECLHFCNENPQWHPDERTTFQHTLNALKRAQKHSFEVQVATAVHDIGKYAVRKDGSTKYHGHAHAGKLMIPAIADRLLWSKDLRKACEFACENHMKMHVIEEMRPFKRRELYTDENFGLLYNVHACDTGDRSDDKHFPWIISDAMKLLRADATITGKDILAQGITGPRVGELKEMCHEAQLDGAFDTHEEGIEYLRGIIRGDIYEENII